VTTSQTLRNRELAQIHIAKQQLGMEDDAYRDVLWSIARVRSAKDLDWTGRKRVLDHLKSCGARLGHKGKGKPHSLDTKPLLQKIEALLADMEMFWGYAEGILKRMHRVDKLDFATAAQLKDVVAALTVEQEKRHLLGQVEELLKQRGHDRMWVVSWLRQHHPNRVEGWQRNRATLRAVIAVLADEHQN
jgi:phage gp16-like protein